MKQLLLSVRALRQKRRSTQFHLLSKAIQLEETFDPRLSRTTMIFGSAMVFLILIWSAFANLNELARTSGTIEPVGNVRVVQHLDGGIVETIHVFEGQSVEEGELLITLAGGNLAKDLSRATRRLRQLKIDEIRYRAYLEGHQPNFAAFGRPTDIDIADAWETYRSQMTALKDRIRVAELQRDQSQRDLTALFEQSETLENRLKDAVTIYTTRKDLFSKGLITRQKLLQSKEAVDRIDGDFRVLSQRIQATIKVNSEREARIDSIRAEDRAVNYSNLNSVLVMVRETEELVDKLTEQSSRLKIVAPIGGIVKGLELSEPGEVVQAATTIVKVVPIEEELVARIKISPRDIGHLRIGMPVQVKVSAYEFGRYGAVNGQLSKISPTTFEGEGGTHYYSGEIELLTTFVGDAPGIRPVTTGMIVSADIVTGSKSILQYLLQPVYSSVSVALSER